MKKVKEILGSIYYYAVVIAAIYFIIEYPKYFFTLLFGIIVIGILIVFLSAKQVIWYVEREYEKNNNDVFKNASSNNSELAMTTFRWNIIARKFFEHALNAHYVKTHTSNQSNNNQGKLILCMGVFGLTDSDLSTIEIPDIRAIWKKFAREYHPDLFQDEELKNVNQDKFIKITKCRDRLIAFIKTRRQNV